MRIGVLGHSGYDDLGDLLRRVHGVVSTMGATLVVEPDLHALLPKAELLKGAEGLDVHHGTHLLIGDTPGDFAEQCARLMDSPGLGLDLAERAFEFVATNHSPERIRELLRQDHEST